MDLKSIFIARACHEVNKVYCEMLKDYSQVPWEDSPDWQKESIINGVNYMLQNPQVTSEEMHDNWAKEKVANGWAYGEVKDSEKKIHNYLLPYKVLPKEQRKKHEIFSTIVKLLK